MKQKKIPLVIFILLSFYLSAQSQHEIPNLLKGPANWTFERFNLPPVFAPSFPFHGFEELRFAPGMFTKGASDYFTYAFAAAIDNKKTFTRAALIQYLQEYFKGLCFSTARDNKLIVDTSKIKVALGAKSPGNIYQATLHIFGVFADGAPVTLNMEIKVVEQKSDTKFYLIFLASPKPSADKVWEQLHEIREGIVFPGSQP